MIESLKRPLVLKRIRRGMQPIFTRRIRASLL
jgi:hypothetical protein